MKLHLKIPFLALGFTAMLAGGTEKQESPPNIVFILADDLGYTQIGCNGSNYYKTPHIDRLASEGIRFTNAYAAAPVCSPTRASIMTGKHPARLHLTNFIPGNSRDIYPLTQPKMQQFLPVEEITLGNLFSEQGYLTAMFGKWHLSPVKFGPESLPFYPDKQGFTHHFVIDKPSIQANPELDAHWSDKIGSSSVEFIRENAGKPFFLYMSFSAIHDPLIERADSVEKWRKHPDSTLPENNPIIAAMLARLDKNVGKVLDVLDELKLAEKTIVIFYSDNGGLAINNVVYFLDYYPEGEKMRIAKQTPLREGKGWLYEGGIRVPLAIRWPGVVDKGLLSHEVVSSYDFLPTFCDLLGVTEPPDIDGVSLLPYLKTGNDFPQRSHFWHFPHYHNGPPCAVIRNGKWKLIEWYEKSLLGEKEQAYELYNLEADQGETTNLADSLKTLTEQLAGQLQQWRATVNAQMPERKN
jgi:arylsulfatase A